MNQTHEIQRLRHELNERTLQVEQLRKEIERLRAALGRAHAEIMRLRKEQEDREDAFDQT